MPMPLGWKLPVSDFVLPRDTVAGTQRARPRPLAVIGE